MTFERYADVYYGVKNFLETHEFSELLEIIKYCVESKEYENTYQKEVNDA